MAKSSHPLGELALIDLIRRSSQRRTPALALGIGDDCAILRAPSGHEILVTTDFSLENRHFRRDTHPPESVGHRCMARGISDLAAMGATPLAAFLSLALPADLLTTRSGQSWISRFFKGLHTLADRCKTPLAGGDTAESPAGLILADITLVGSAPSGQSLRRSTARSGDLLYVTGHLGGAAAELQSLLAKTRIRKDDSHPHLFPEPRIAIGKYLLKHHLATACIDLSDGLSTDLTHLCQASSLHATVNESALPIHPLAACHSKSAALALALHGGEDYELLFTASPATKIPRKIAGITITPIGSLTRKRRDHPGIILLSSNGIPHPLQPQGWEHFRSIPA